MDHLKSDNGALFITKANQKWAESRSIWQTFQTSYNPKAIGTFEHWNGLLENWLKKISDSISLTIPWSTHISKDIWLLNMAVPIKASLSLGHAIERELRERYWLTLYKVIYTYMKIQDSALITPRHDVPLFTPTAILRMSSVSPARKKPRRFKYNSCLATFFFFDCYDPRSKG